MPVLNWLGKDNAVKTAIKMKKVTEGINYIQ